jgi:hypothetical protein
MISDLWLINLIVESKVYDGKQEYKIITMTKIPNVDSYFSIYMNTRK